MPPEEKSPKRILLIDDEEHIRVTLAEALRMKGYAVTELGDGADAYIWLQTNRTDLIITGIKMPELGGFGLMQRLQKDPALKKIPVFIFSHRGDAEDKAKAFELGAVDFMVYGFITPNEIAETIKRFFGEATAAYNLKLDLRLLDGPRFRKDFPDIILPSDSVTVTVEPGKNGQAGEFKMRLG